MVSRRPGAILGNCEAPRIVLRHSGSGEAGPFSMLTYGAFSNGRSLTPAEIDTLIAWVEAKAPKGDPRDMPAPVQWHEGWGIGKPDQVF